MVQFAGGREPAGLAERTRLALAEIQLTELRDHLAECNAKVVGCRTPPSGSKETGGVHL